jgi:hypothetical protein
VPKHLARETAVAAEDPTLPHLWRDAAALPGWSIGLAGAAVLAGGAAGLQTGAVGWWHAGWLSAGTCLIVCGRRAARRADGDAELGEPWAYGPAGRTAAGGLAAYHLVALVIWQLPAWPTLVVREEARRLVDPWMELTFTRQLWTMFSPNAPRSNASLRTRVIDAAGAEHDLRTELEHPENLARPYVWHDRWRKIDEVILGTRKFLGPWHARYLCRRWALAHGGEAPREVVLEQVKAPIVPLAPGDPIALFWASARVEPVVRVTCATEPFAQLDDEVRARHGLAPAVAGSLVQPWPERQERPEPWTPMWWLLALGLGGGVVAWAREDRRRQVARARAQRLSAEPRE